MNIPLVRLGTVAEIERHGVDPDQILPGTSYVGLEHIQGDDGTLSAVNRVNPGDLASTKFAFSEKHVLFGKLRPYLRKIARPDSSGICSTDIIPIAPMEKLDRDYLFHFLRTDTVIDRATSMASGANLPRISPKHLLDFEIPFPPLREQRRIATILDLTRDLLRKRRETLLALDDLARAVFFDLFGDPVLNPKKWDEDLHLGDVAELVSGITKGRKLNGGATRDVPYLAVANVQDKSLNLKTIKTIEATDDEIRRYRLMKDDLLLTEGGDPDKLGRGTLWNDEIEECIHQNHVFRVRLNSDRLHPTFLNWIVGSQRGKAYFLRSAKQTTGIASINMTQLRGFPLLVPPYPLQKKFADSIVEIERLKACHSAHAKALDALFASLQHRAFRGEL